MEDHRPVALGLAIAFALAFALTNGFHDAANSIATLVATRGARPGQAIALSAVFNSLGVLLIGSAVASTIAGITTVDASIAVEVIGSGVLAAVIWNLLTWRRGPAVELGARAGRGAGRLGAHGRGHRRGQLGRPRRLAPGRRLRRADRPGGLARHRPRRRVRASRASHRTCWDGPPVAWRRRSAVGSG